jgi:sterol desaturase/sphingolipid hydroxylase (fatty acid hydroxylase superfamily)
MLWEFHKVHHSAEVLTPLTNLRVHPVDVALEAFLTSIATGVVIGAYGYWYPGGVVEFTILGTTLVYFLFSLIGNLRHSHIRLQFGPRMSKFLCSPFMHQIHHSCETRHFDKNFAVIFSFWDHLARTIWIPKDDEEFRLGIGEESKHFYSMWGIYVGPFLAIFRKRKPVQQPVG